MITVLAMLLSQVQKSDKKVANCVQLPRTDVFNVSLLGGTKASLVYKDRQKAEDRERFSKHSSRDDLAYR